MSDRFPAENPGPSDQPGPVQYATRRERRAAERAAEEAARQDGPDQDALEADDDGVAFGAGAALTREEYEARMAELTEQAGEHAVSLSRHGSSAVDSGGPHGPAHGEHLGAEHAGPEHVDPAIRAEQEALAARAAALNAAQRGTPAGPAITDSPVSFVPGPAVPVAEPHEAHNLGAVTPLRYEHDPAFDFPVIAPPTTSQVFLTWDPATGTVQPLQGTRLEDGASAGDIGASTEPGPATGWVPTAALLEAGATSTTTTPGAAAAEPAPVPVGAADAAGLDPLDARTARKGRRSWVGVLIGAAVVVVVGLAVLAVLLLAVPR
ncbi:hypothetical protein BKD30_07960 [Tersicoccus phoenicis]|uniref:Uncharacterized protein n=1 Tax=Tersicoccus phoenicis TaxID=554083 RepID=A0A1R1LAY3_9MICC|nr:hypothetical protein [Tersicoccus phoenicis]OMH24694.1 hypothetical protein BKD30_07960 [Tersicoccus phoenicis]